MVHLIQHLQINGKFVISMMSNTFILLTLGDKQSPSPIYDDMQSFIKLLLDTKFFTIIVCVIGH